MDFLYFLGRFHVLVLHLPIGIILCVVALELVARRAEYRYLESAGAFLWGAAAVTAILTVALGYLHFAEGGFEGPTGAAHRLYGTSVAVAASLLWLARAKARSLYRKIQIPGAVVVLALLVMAGHYGGNLTHGSTYLVEYAPQPLRSLAGLGAKRPPVTDLAMADAWLDVVKPILDARCSSCHGRDKQNADFDMSTHASTLAGGETGSAIVPGNVSVSELYRRITLPESDDAFMPAEGRTPLSAREVAIIGWWIESGAPSSAVVGTLDVPSALGPALAAAVGLAPDSASPTVARAADLALLAELGEAGLIPRPMAISDSHLAVSVASPGRALSVAQWQALADAAADIEELNLQSSGLDDEEIASVVAMSGLTRLRLDNNELTDTAVRSLAALESLGYLNLYGNAGITDASIETFIAMPRLRELYVWQTGLTADGIARLRAARPELDVQSGTAEAFTAGAAQSIAEANGQ